jgi:hypothetical protein
MKKIALLLLTLTLAVISSSTFATVKFGYNPQNPSNGKDFVAKIVGVDYEVAENGIDQSVMIMLKADDKLNESNLNGGTLIISGNDLPFGMALAASVGKKVAVNIDADHVPRVVIITDEYWNGSKK